MIIFANPVNAIRIVIELFNKFSLETRIPYRIAVSEGIIEYDETSI